jgi:hypothetical protein
MKEPEERHKTDEKRGTHVFNLSHTLQRHNTENSKQIFPEKENCTAPVTISCICERFIYSLDRSAYSATGKYVDRSWEQINLSQVHECGIGTEAAILFWEYINGIFSAVHYVSAV